MAKLKMQKQITTEVTLHTCSGREDTQTELKGAYSIFVLVSSCSGSK